MKKTLLPKTSLLKSTEILNQENVARALGITERSASNLLQRWTTEGILFRTGPGCYMSVFAEKDLERLVIQSLVKRLGNSIILVGASSWKRIGWCDSTQLHVAVPLSPSRRMPRIRDTVIYPVGSKVWSTLSKHSLQMDIDKPPILHPISQMLWWMDRESPIEMPSPDRVNWNAIRAEPQVAEAMCKHWPDELKGQEKDLNVEFLYRMLHMDRLKGDLPGRAEPFDPPGPVEDGHDGISR